MSSQLQPAQRIDLIKRLGTHLRQDSDPHLVLDEFGVVELFNNWNEPVPPAERVRQADDEQLIALSEYFDLVITTGAAVIPPTPGEEPWPPTYLRVFLSHHHSARAQASELKSWLRPLGFAGFVAHDDITPSSQWVEVVKFALKTCDMLILIVDEQSQASPWCQQEVGWALGRGVPVLALQRENRAPPAFVAAIQGFKSKSSQLDARDIAAKAMPLLNPGAGVRVPMAVAKGVADAQNFDEAKFAGANSIPLVEQWTDDAKRILGSALKQNSQVAKAWHVPEQIRNAVPDVDSYIPADGFDDSPFE